MFMFFVLYDLRRLCLDISTVKKFNNLFPYFLDKDDKATLVDVSCLFYPLPPTNFHNRIICPKLTGSRVSFSST